jgi:hypothetical protein
MTSPSQRLDGTSGGRPPLVEIGAAEVQLAPGPSLLGRNRAFGRQPADAVATDAEVIGRTTSVEPLVGTLPLRRREASSDAISDQLDELAKELRQNVATLPNRQRGGGGGGMRTFYEPQLRR